MKELKSGMWLRGQRQIECNWHCFLFTVSLTDAQLQQMHPFIALGMNIFAQTLFAHFLSKWWRIIL